MPFLCAGPIANAQTLIESFDDDTRDQQAWFDPDAWTGNEPNLTEINQRLEFSAGYSDENEVNQQFQHTASLHQPWEVQMSAWVDPAMFTNEGQDGSLAITIGTSAPGDDNYLSVGLGAGVLGDGITEKQAIFAEGADAANPDPEPKLLLGAYPTGVAVRVVYDPHRRLLQTYYDLDTDPTDGEWTPYHPYTIDGSDQPGVPFDHQLNWAMTEGDVFYLTINGHSNESAITSGLAWADDFLAVIHPLLLTPTHADDFNDNSIDTSIWNDLDQPEGDSNTLLTEQNERLEFSASFDGDNYAAHQLNDSPTYWEPWQAQCLLSTSQANFVSPDHMGYMMLTVGAPGHENYLDLVNAAGHLPLPGETGNIQAIVANGADTDNPDGTLVPFVGTLPEEVGVRLTYDPNLRLIRTYYDLDADQTDNEWTPLQAFTIDDSSLGGALPLDWGMTDQDSFNVELAGGSEGGGVASGTAWADEFQIHLGSTARGEPGNWLFDDFNDDSTDSGVWEDLAPDQGNPSWVDANQRVEFLSPSESPSGEQKRVLTPAMWPRFDQGFEVELEAHCYPEDLSADGQNGIIELMVSNSSGEGDLFLSIGAIYLDGSVQQLIFSDNSHIDTPDDWPEELTLLTPPDALPDIVGLRISWDPVTKVLSCYVDTDGDRTVPTWTLFSDYSLDGPNPNTTRSSDWGMVSSDSFLIGVAATAEDTSIESGETYLDNFSLIIQTPSPSPTGYDQWAAALSEEMRDPTQDASGNGIPNVVQYLYGLGPMDLDTDVNLKVLMEDGTPALVHGYDSTVTDYQIEYQLKSELTEPTWTQAPLASFTSETFESNGKTFRKLTPLPGVLGDSLFVRLAAVPRN